MVVIIEGVDGVGKTTICKKIAELTNLNYIKESYTEDVEDKLARISIILIRILDQQKDYIYDRATVIDDFVYDFLNNKKYSDLYEYRDIIYSLLAHCKIIHLNLDEKTRISRLDQRGDKYITNDMIKHIKYKYELFYDNVPNVSYIDLTGNIDEDVKKIMEEINND